MSKFFSEAKPLAIETFGHSFADKKGITIAEALSEVGGDYSVSKRKMLLLPEMFEVGQQVTITADMLCDSHCATYANEHNVLGVVGADYGVIQNSNAFSFVDMLNEAGAEISIDNIGILNGGKRVFVSSVLGESAYANGTEAIRNYLIFTNSHDGSSPFMVFITPVRVVCQNTLNMAIKGAKNKLVYKHTSRVNERVDWEQEMNIKKVAEILKASKVFNEEFIENMNFLASQKATEVETNKFVCEVMIPEALLPKVRNANYDLKTLGDILSTQTKNKIKALRESIEGGVGQDTNRGNFAWLLNGLTTYLHNDFDYKGDAEKEVNSMLDGYAQAKTQKGYDYLMKVAS